MSADVPGGLSEFDKDLLDKAAASKIQLEELREQGTRCVASSAAEVRSQREAEVNNIFVAIDGAVAILTEFEAKLMNGVQLEVGDFKSRNEVKATIRELKQRLDALLADPRAVGNSGV